MVLKGDERYQPLLAYISKKQRSLTAFLELWIGCSHRCRGLDGIGLDSAGSGCAGVTGLGWTGQEGTGLDRIGRDWMGLDWSNMQMVSEGCRKRKTRQVKL